MNYQDDADLPQFSSEAACEAAGIDSATLKNWISRKPSAVTIGEDERVTAGKKTTYRFSLRRVLQIAITAELVRLGYGPRDASLHAAGFTGPEPEPLPGRTAHPMGELFRKNFTLLLIYPGGHSEVVNVKADDAWRIVMRAGLGVGRQPAATIVNLNDIDRHVRTTLGLPLTARDWAV